MSVIRKNNVLPGAYGVLKNKMRRIYDKCLEILTLLVLNSNPEIVICDFEINAINFFNFNSQM